MEAPDRTNEPTPIPGSGCDGTARAKLLGAVAVGCIVGIVLTCLLVWMAMPSMMLTAHQSRFSTVEETCEALEKAIEDNGWHCPAIRDMNASMAKEGVIMDGPVRIVELCNANYAHDVLVSNPEVSTLMPCAWGVYEGPDGTILISGMNMGLMGKMFGGRIAEVMGGAVAEDERTILSGVVVDE